MILYIQKVMSNQIKRNHNVKDSGNAVIPIRLNVSMFARIIRDPKYVIDFSLRP